jgi:hypothetical protein
MSRVASVAQNGIPPVEDVPKPKPQTNLDTPEAQSHRRMLMVSGMTGMASPDMTPEERSSFENGKLAGAVSVPVVAGATAGATLAAPSVADAVGLAKEYAEYYGQEVGEKLAEFGKAHPIAAKAAGVYTSWLATHIASKLGVPMPRLLKRLADL